MESSHITVNGVRLTLGEARVLSLLRLDLSRKQIGVILGITESTIDKRLKIILLKIVVKTSNGAGIWATENGFDTKGCVNGQYLFHGFDTLPWTDPDNPMFR